MAVIVTNREVPIRCVTCWHRMNCEYWEQTVEGYKNRNCPIKELEKEPFINKPCVSKKVCEHDKNVALDKIKAEIERGKIGLDIEFNGGIDYALSIIDKYMAKSEE